MIQRGNFIFFLQYIVVYCNLIYVTGYCDFLQYIPCSSHVLEAIFHCSDCSAAGVHSALLLAVVID